MSFFINFDRKDILRQAKESTLRYEKGIQSFFHKEENRAPLHFTVKSTYFQITALSAGEPISVLDGVPVAVKDEIDCLPYPTTG